MSLLNRVVGQAARILQEHGSIFSPRLISQVVNSQLYASKKDQSKKDQSKKDSSKDRCSTAPKSSDSSKKTRQKLDCPKEDKQKCAYKDANRHKKAVPKPCPPKRVPPKMNPWCLDPRLKNLAKKKLIEIKKDPCLKDKHKCPRDESVAYRHTVKMEQIDQEGTMKKKRDFEKLLDNEFKKARKRMERKSKKMTDHTCCEQEKHNKSGEKCGKND